ncbi:MULTISPECIES: hypothetical protein [unclassified Dehalobacter]|uniref:hypothetical protein n=1 Tax=unclassified Dehalobacter TaxID=2635733 RepID=UPI001043F967|nr:MULTISPECIES: hypothetical protein [unclassified Dehalobacter]TCX49160.1 hypothetical protein C1I36_10695 [Dehalobacter sp. 14DCB1]TCX55306.1 hypothetical protein C1I38_03565 [Dehalobacter sp. 12DCB1]
MTIIAAIKTGTDLVLAADSKVTTKGFGGIVDGQSIWLDQTYDYCTKIAFSLHNCFTAAVAGQASFGDIQTLDIIKEFDAVIPETREAQHNELMKLVNKINELRSLKYHEIGIPEQYLPVTYLILGGSDPEGRGVNAWHITFQSNTPTVMEILKTPTVFLAGAADNALTLLYNYSFGSVNEVAATLEMESKQMNEAFNNLVSPINKINFSAMPIQDAMDMAAFLAKVQIQMDRFLPGIGSCGGPIDIAVVHGLPRNEVRWFPGKELHYPTF